MLGLEIDVRNHQEEEQGPQGWVTRGVSLWRELGREVPPEAWVTCEVSQASWVTWNLMSKMKPYVIVAWWVDQDSLMASWFGVFNEQLPGCCVVTILWGKQASELWRGNSPRLGSRNYLERLSPGYTVPWELLLEEGSFTPARTAGRGSSGFCRAEPTLQQQAFSNSSEVSQGSGDLTRSQRTCLVLALGHWINH